MARAGDVMRLASLSGNVATAAQIYGIQCQRFGGQSEQAADAWERLSEAQEAMGNALLALLEEVPG